MLPKRDFLGTQAQPLGIRSQCPPPPQPCGKTIIANFAFWRWHHTRHSGKYYTQGSEISDAINFL